MSAKKNKSSEPPNDFPEYVVVTDQLDLHGFFPEQIPKVIEEFIRNARELNLTRLTVIHGKGKSKLKSFAKNWRDIRMLLISVMLRLNLVDGDERLCCYASPMKLRSRSRSYFVSSPSVFSNV